MKKILPILLSCLLLVSFTACGAKHGGADSDTVETTVSDQRDNGADTTRPDNTGNDGSGDTTPEGNMFALNAAVSGVRLLGEREKRNSNYLSCEYPGSGFESKIRCDGGTVSLRVMTADNCSFMIWLDGVPQMNSDGKNCFTVLGDSLITIAQVSAGEHTLRVIRTTDFGVDARLYALIFSGEMLSVDSYGKERKFIEFIGDGVNSTVGATPDSSDVSKTYPYLVASQMDVDYAITAYNGYGLVCTEPTIGEKISGDFSRKADIAVINAGSLDVLASGEKTVSAAEFKNAYRELVRKVRLLNGETCKIVLVCTNGNDDFRNAVRTLYADLGCEDNGYYLMMLPTSATLPPSENDHKQYAEALAAYLAEIQDDKVSSLSYEQNGTGNAIAMSSDKWRDI